MSFQQNHRAGAAIALIAASFLLVISCTSIAVTKVSPNTNPPGFRYYLPRPFVAVKQEFPIESYDQYTYGTIKIINGDKWIQIPKEVLINLGIYLEADKLTKLPKNASMLYGQTDSGPRETIEVGETKKTDASSSSGSSDKPASSDSSGGSSSGGLVPEGVLFDIVYLPDFSEQYAIQIKPGLGSGDYSYKLTNGWMLENIAIKTDNTALTNALFSQIGKVIDFASSAGLAKLGVSETSKSATELQGEVKREAGTQETRSEENKILIRIRTVQYAIPGLYPIYKPAELTKKKDLWGNTIEGINSNQYDVWRFSSPLWGETVAFRTRKEITFEPVRLEANQETNPTQSSSRTDQEWKKLAQDRLGTNSKLAQIGVVQITLSTDGKPTKMILAGSKGNKTIEEESKKTLRGLEEFASCDIIFQ